MAIALVATAAGIVQPHHAGAASTVLHRINAGGPSQAGDPTWTTDSKSSPSPYVNASATGNRTYTSNGAIDLSDPSVPAGTPAALFTTERYDDPGRAELEYSLPVTAGESVDVRLYFAETYTGNYDVGARVFDVRIEDALVIDDLDVYAEVGARTAYVESVPVTSDGTIDIEFIHQVQNPAIKAIEIVTADGGTDPEPNPSELAVSPESLAFGGVTLGETATAPVTLANDVGPDGSALQIDSVSISGTGQAAFSHDAVTPLTLAPGEQTTIDVTFAPTSASPAAATLTVAHDGSNSPQTVSLSGEGTSPPGGAAGVLHRVNAGGPSQVGDPTWETDTTQAPSTYVNASQTGNKTYASSGAIDMSHPSVPADTPAALFTTERYDDPGGADLQYSFPVAAGEEVDVRLYFAETYTGTYDIGARVFDVQIDNTLVIDDLDVYAAVGARTGYVETLPVTSDGTIDIGFTHEVQNPAIKAIEILVPGTDPDPDPDPEPGTLAVSPDALPFGGVTVGEIATSPVTLANNDSQGGADIAVDTIAITGPDAAAFSHDATTPITLSPGEQTTVNVTYAPTVATASAATLTVSHDGSNSPQTVALSGEGTAPSSSPGEILHRVNAGGPSQLGDPTWATDTRAAPSPYVNASATGNLTYTAPGDIDMSHPTVPADTPEALFTTERYDNSGGDELKYSFPVTAGEEVEVRLYLAEIYDGNFTAGTRVFDVRIDDTLVIDDLDIYATVGARTGYVESLPVTSDGTIDIEFIHEIQNPAIKAIEIISAAPRSGELGAQPGSLSLPQTLPGESSSSTVQIRNLGGPGDPAITVESTAITGADAAVFSDDFDDTAAVLAPGEHVDVVVTFSPEDAGPRNATLEVTHDGTNATVLVPLSASTIVASFLPKDKLAGAAPSFPTSIAWGPDGRLYVATMMGTIHAYSVERTGPGQYAATSSETISLIAEMPNRDDDGTLNPSVAGRLVTGIDVAGTAQNPQIYAVSSDPRIGGGGTDDEDHDLPLDTNSGILSRLTFDGSQWQKLDLVRGLPRSKENHTGNGIVVDQAAGTALIAYGGNTNKGAPSFNFVGLPEFALSAAILTVDLAAIGDTTYDLPTLDDEDRAGVDDANDPFGGNGGKNQARLIDGGPVGVYSPGWRNPYDVVVTESGQVYAVDNGGNAGWGGYPLPDSPDGTCTNDLVDTSDSDPDTLIHIPGPGYYAGHPNPVRANPSITFNDSNPQSPVDTANPVECDYLDPETERNALAIFPDSTNGLDEYTTDNFDGAMRGALLTAGHDKTIYVVHLDSTGTAAVSSSALFNSVGVLPLDVIASSADDPFPGTIIVADAGGDSIGFFEPTDYDGEQGPVCTGADDPGLDEDDDGFDNSDEIANGTNPCSAGDVPPDNDEDLESDLVDPDDDNDGIPDVSDPFALDAANGRGTALPVDYEWENDGSNPGGLFNLGFTGLMGNGVSDYLDLFDSGNMTAGGAAGITTIDEVGSGTAHGPSNDQEYGFQFGIDVDSSSEPFTVSTGLVSPFPGGTDAPGQELGMFFGTGTQDDYVELVASTDAGGQIVARIETAGTLSTVATLPVTLPGPEDVALSLHIDPGTATAQAYTSVDGAVPVAVGSPFPVPATWFDGPSGPAVGLISTSTSTPFPATWDFLRVIPDESTDPDPEPGTGTTFLEVNTGNTIDSSTYSSDSFRITNGSDEGSMIEQVVFDLSTSVLPDLVFDPDGTAGDLTAKDFTVDSDPGTGFTGNTFSGPHATGYDAVTIDFDDFGQGETFTFSIDVDPTSIKGVEAPGPNETGSVSGLEIAGATVTVVYDDGSTQVGRLFRSPGSVSNASLTLSGESPPTPTISIDGETSPLTTDEPTLTVNVSGAPSSTVRLAALEGGLYLSGVPGGGYDVDPFEANTLVQVTETEVTLDASGNASVPVTLSQSDAAAGIWHLVAATAAGGDVTSSASEVLVVNYEPASG